MANLTPHLDIRRICQLYFAQSEQKLSAESLDNWHTLLRELNRREFHNEACRYILWHRKGSDRVVLFLSLIAHARKEFLFQKLHAAVRRRSPVARLRFAMALVDYLDIEKGKMVVWQWESLTDAAFETLQSVVDPFWHHTRGPQITQLQRTSKTLLNLSAIVSKPEAIRLLGVRIAEDIAGYRQLAEPETVRSIRRLPHPAPTGLTSLPH